MITARRLDLRFELRDQLRLRVGLGLLSQVRSVELLISIDGSGAAANFSGPGDGDGDGDGDCSGDL